MANYATFIDVEDWLIGALNPGVPVLTKIPTRDDEPVPTSWVRVIRLPGTGRVTRISEQATVVVESFAPTETAAQSIAQACRNALGEMEGAVVGGVHVKGVTEDSGIGNLPIQSVPAARYTQTFTLHLKGLTS